MVSKSIQSMSRLKGHSMVRWLWRKNYCRKDIFNGVVVNADQVVARNRSCWEIACAIGAISSRLPTTTHGDHFLQVVGLSRRHCWHIWQWKLGLCGGSWMKCTSCAISLPLEHFLTCANSHQRIRMIMEAVNVQQLRGTVYSILDGGA